MDELAAGGQGISFGNGKTRTGDRFFDAETFGETAHQGGFAGANIADEFDDGGWGDFLSQILAKSEHFLFRMDFHYIILYHEYLYFRDYWNRDGTVGLDGQGGGVLCVWVGFGTGGDL